MAPYSDFFTMTAIDVLTDYLTDNSASPFQREMIEVDDPYASDVSFSMQDYDMRVLELTFDSVPVGKLEEVEEKAIKLMTDIASQENSLDTSLMQTLLRKSRLDFLERLENEPDEMVPEICIPHFIYGVQTSDWSGLANAFDELSRLQQLNEKDPAFWANLLKTYIVNKPRVTVVSHPSSEKAKQIEIEDKRRFDKRRQTLGEKGLYEYQQTVKQAHARNDAPFDQSYITNFPIPPVQSIERHAATLYTAGPISTGYRLPNDPLMPVPALMSDVNSNFVTTGIVMRTDNLSERQRMMLPLLIMCVFFTGIERSGTFVGPQQIAQEIADASISYSRNVGYRDGSVFGCGRFTCASIEMRTEPDMYTKCVKLIADCVIRMRPTKDRLVAVTKKALNRAPKMLREGEVIAADMLHELNFQQTSMQCCTNALKQQTFLKAILQQLKKGAAETVIGELHQLRKELISPERMSVFVNGRLMNLGEHLLDPWRDVIHGLDRVRYQSYALLPKTSSAFLSPVGTSGGAAAIIGISSVESGYAEVTTPAVTSAEHPDVASIFVAAEVLQALEGPFWREIRGNGLAYGAHISLSTEQGLLHFNLHRCNQVTRAMSAAKQIVEEFVNEERKVDEIDIENAVSSTVFSITSREQTPSEAGSFLLDCVFSRLPLEHNANLLARVRQVNRAAVLDILQRYFVPLFQPEQSTLSICCAPSKVASTKAEFEQMGYHIAKYDSLQEAFSLVLSKEQREQLLRQQQQEQEKRQHSGKQEDNHGAASAGHAMQPLQQQWLQEMMQMSSQTKKAKSLSQQQEHHDDDDDDNESQGDNGGDGTDTGGGEKDDDESDDENNGNDR